MASPISISTAGRRAGVALVVVVAAVLIAACGGSGAASAGGTSTNSALAVKFARCIRAHGVPQYPDPGANQNVEQSGNTTGGGTATVQGHAIPQSVLTAAERRCAKDDPYVVSQPKYSAAQLAKVQADGLRFSACVRTHGDPDYPDQKVEPGVDGHGYRYVVVGRTPKFAAPAVMNRAMSACGHLLNRGGRAG